METTAAIAVGSVVGYFVLAAVAVRLPPLPWVRHTNRFRPPRRHKAPRQNSDAPSGAGKAEPAASLAVAHPGEARSPRQWLNIAHRGGSLVAPENTLLAFRRGIAAHADMLELDVQESADGVPVVAHDNNLNRITGRPGTVSADVVVGGDPSKLPLLATSVPLHFFKGDEDTYTMSASDLETVGRQRMCTLEEVLEAFPDTPLHIDIKLPSPTLVASVVDLVQHKFPGRGHITALGAAGTANSKLVHAAVQAAEKHDAAERRKRAQQQTQQEQDGDVPDNPSDAKPLTAPPKPATFATFASARQVITTYALYYTGLLPFVPLSFDVFDFPLPTAPLRERMLGHAQQRGWLMSCLGNTLLWVLTAPNMWQHLRRRGIWVFGFVQNLPSEFDEVVAQRWPVDGVMTDDPIALHDWLVAHHWDSDRQSSSSCLGRRDKTKAHGQAEADAEAEASLLCAGDEGGDGGGSDHGVTNANPSANANGYLRGASGKEQQSSSV